MDLEVKFTGSVQARASLKEGGELKVQLQGSAPYRLAKVGEGDEARDVELTAAITVDVNDAALVAPVKAALEALLAQAPKILGPKLQQAIFKAQSVAEARQEAQ